MTGLPWYYVKNISGINSPSILVFPDRIRQNILRMIEIAGSPERLRPHVKTHKMSEIVRLQMDHGIKKFKCSTIAEAEMAADCGAKDILLAMQPVGPNLERFFLLKRKYKDIKISCIVDNHTDVQNIRESAKKYGIVTHIWLDINVGMNRTGIIPGREAIILFNEICDSSMLVTEGFHVYDGHIHESDPEKRKKQCSEAFAPVSKMVSDIEKSGTKIRIVAGGTPSFPVHARYGSAELSPGTTLLWDYGYSKTYRDLDFLHAAVLLTRIVSKPAPGLLCLDLGHKAVASEMPHPRVIFPDLTDYEFTGHNEEHLVLRTPEAGKYHTGDVLYGIPWHICPTIDRHDRATVVRNNEATEEWEIVARRRKITI
jgi:D-serine deaminase-like pyridoxal phosphate-dependent protein